jgi:RNA polymerase sigma-70 factor (ECF subfamily)
LSHTGSITETAPSTQRRVESAVGGGHAGSTFRLDAESRVWWSRLHGRGAVRDRAIAELYERLRREAGFHLRLRASRLACISSAEVDDLAAHAASDALLAVLRKLETYRGDSQFWTWARRFAQLEASVCIRRRLRHERLVDHFDWETTVADPRGSPQELIEIREQLQELGELICGALTANQRTVLVAVTLNGVAPASLAAELRTSRGAIYKTLHDARRKLAAELAVR